MSRAVGAALAAALLLAPAADAFAVSCNVEGPDATIKYRNDALHFQVDGRVVAAIGDDYALSIDGRPVPLTPEQQFAVASYRAGYDALVAEAKEIGLAGARLGMRAALVAVTSIFSSNPDAVRSRYDLEFEALEERAETLCALAESLKEQHAQLEVAVPEFGRALAPQL